MPDEQKLLTMKVTHFFLGTLRMKNTSIGYCYWIDAITYYIKKYEKEEYIYSFEINEIYTYLSYKYDKDFKNIEKLMRYAREGSQYKEYFKTNRLTNSQFFIRCIDKFMPNKLEKLLFHE